MQALAEADEVYIGAVNRAEKMKTGERFEPGVVACALQKEDVSAHTADSNAALLEKLLAQTLPPRDPRVVVFFTNGSFDGIIGHYAAAARSAQ